MSTMVVARFSAEAEAESALSKISSQVPLLDSAVVNDGLRGSLMLDSLNLTQEERARCEAQLKQGGFVLVAQTTDEASAAAVLRILDGTDGGGEPVPPRSNPQAAAEAPQTPSAPQPAEAEERIPLVEEELRIGKREMVSGGARVRSFTREVPVQEEVELLHEEASISRRPVNRRLSDEELVQSGLLQDRVMEITLMREEAVVSKAAFVREEVVVTKTVERRVEQIHETVRRTEVETERLAPGERPALGFGTGDRQPLGTGEQGEDQKR